MLDVVAWFAWRGLMGCMTRSRILGAIRSDTEPLCGIADDLSKLYGLPWCGRIRMGSDRHARFNRGLPGSSAAALEVARMPRSGGGRQPGELWRTRKRREESHSFEMSITAHGTK